MPRPGVTRTDSKSDRQPLFSNMDGESANNEFSASMGIEQQNREKGNASHSSPISQPKLHGSDKNRVASSFLNASTPGGKSQASPKSNTGNGASQYRKSSSAEHSPNQQKIPLLVEVDDSWQSSEAENVYPRQARSKVSAPGISGPTKKASQPTLRNTDSSTAKPLGKKASISTAKLAKTDTGQESSLVESSSEQTRDVGPSSGTSGQKSSSTAKAKAANPARTRASIPDASQLHVKLARRQTQGGFVTVEMVQAQKAKAMKKAKQRPETPTPATIARMNIYKADLIALMTAEDTDENAEALYEEVARICTDKELGNKQKLECLRAEAGKVCTTLTKDVNEYFEALVIEQYVDHHAPDPLKGTGPKKGMHSDGKGEKKSLLSNSNDENDDDDVEVNKENAVDGHVDAKYDQKRVLELFKSTLSKGERKKLENIKPEGKFSKDPGRKEALQRVELLRKMQKKLTDEERKSVRENAKNYHDLLANSGLPVLHIAVKNESCKLVRAYLLAVMAFAPFDIKKEAIQATQHQGLQAFYWAMTHSTTDMIRMFMETVLNSDFLFHKEKQEILHARRPDPQKNGIYGIGGFYMAMASGDIARADAFMSQLLAWDPNCRIREYSQIKLDLLEAFKSRWLKHKAKGAAVENGHKNLVRIYNQYVDSSHLRRIEKELLLQYNRIHDPQEEKIQFTNKAESEKTQELIQEVFKTLNIKMPREGGDLPEDVEVIPGVPMQGYTRIHKTIAYERKASILEMNKKPVPEHLKKFSIKDLARRPFKNIDEAEDYAKLATIPEPIQYEKRRTDGDHLLGPLPELSREAKENSWQERKENHTLPPRSGSYASGLVDSPHVPASMPTLPRLDELSPIKLTPSPRRRSSQHTGLSNSTPTRLVAQKAGKPSPTSGVSQS